MAMDRSDYVRECKRAALEYWQRGEMADAITSMLSDMSKRPDTKPANTIALLGMQRILEGDVWKVRAFIEGFSEADSTASDPPPGSVPEGQ